MIILLYGPDSYRRRKKIKEIFEKYKSSHQVWQSFYFNGIDDENEAQLEKLKEFLLNNSIFENTKLAITENLFSEFIVKKDESIINFLKPFIDEKEITLIFSEEKEPSEEFDFLLKKPVLSQGFKNLDESKLQFFIKKEAEARGLALSQKAVYFLSQVFAGDSWALVNELDKLSLYFIKKGEEIDINDLKKIIVGSDRSLDFSDFFTLVNFIINQNDLAKKINSLEYLFINQEEPAKIFNFIASRARQVESVKKLSEYDLLIKSGKIDYEEALLDFIF